MSVPTTSTECPRYAGWLPMPIDSDRLLFALEAVEAGMQKLRCKLPTSTHAALVSAIYELLEGVEMMK